LKTPAYIKTVLVCLLFGVANVASADEKLQSFTAVYDVHHSGARVGETTVTLGPQEDGSWLMASNTRPRGLAKFVRSGNVVETSNFRWNQAGHLEGLKYTFNDGSRKGKRNSTVEFDWTAGNASSAYKKRSVSIELDAPMGDRLSLQALLMRDLARDDIQTHYSVINKNETKTYGFEALEEEVIDTRAGRFNTLKVRQQRAGSSRSSLLWLAVDFGYAPVKVTQFKDGKASTVLTIKKLTQ